MEDFMNSTFDYLNFPALKTPGLRTQPANAFLDEYLRIIRFRAYLGNVHILSAENETIFAIIAKSTTSETRQNLERVWAEAMIMAGGIETHVPLINETTLCRLVDNYLVYIRDLLFLVYKSQPLTLSSAEQVGFDFILQHSNMDDLLTSLAEKRVEELSFKGIRKMSDYCGKHGITLYSSDELLTEAALIIELRNIIVHNRGIISNMFKRRLPDYPAKTGERVHFDDETVTKYAEFLHKSVFDIDARVAKKFNLQQTSEWPLAHLNMIK